MTEQWEHLSTQVRYFTFSKFHQLKSGPRQRLLWLSEKLAALQARGADLIFMDLIRNIKGREALSLPFN